MSRRPCVDVDGAYSISHRERRVVAPSHWIQPSRAQQAACPIRPTPTRSGRVSPRRWSLPVGWSSCGAFGQQSFSEVPPCSGAESTADSEKLFSISPCFASTARHLTLLSHTRNQLGFSIDQDPNGPQQQHSARSWRHGRRASGSRLPGRWTTAVRPRAS